MGKEKLKTGRGCVHTSRAPALEGWSLAPSSCSPWARTPVLPVQPLLSAAGGVQVCKRVSLGKGNKHDGNVCFQDVSRSGTRNKQ